MFKFDFDLSSEGDGDEVSEVQNVENVVESEEVGNVSSSSVTSEDHVSLLSQKSVYALTKLFLQTNSSEEFVFIADKFGGEIGMFVAKTMRKMMRDERIETYLSAFERLEENVILAFVRKVEGAFQDLSVSTEWIESMESESELCPMVKLLILSMAERCIDAVLFSMNRLTIQKKNESEKEIISMSLYKWLGKLDRGRDEFDDEDEFRSTQQSWGDVLSCVRKYGLIIVSPRREKPLERKRKRTKPDPLDTLRDVMYVHKDSDKDSLRNALESYLLLHKPSTHKSVGDEDLLSAFNRLLPHLGTSNKDLERFLSKYVVLMF